jgi:hypothetical protein
MRLNAASISPAHRSSSSPPALSSWRWRRPFACHLLPVFFRQQRYGRNAELFRIYKFRTMSIDQEDRSGIAQTRKNDPRVTASARFCGG